MAICLIFTCNQCGFSIDAWSDGNPYIEDPQGKRHYFYHPSEDSMISEIALKILGHTPTEAEKEELLLKHGGNAPDHICRDCGETSQIDPKRDTLACPHCSSKRIVARYNLGGAPCLKCSGTFSEGSPGAIS